MPQKRNQNKIFIVGFVLIAVVIIWSLARPLVLKMKNGGTDSEEQINAEILKAPLITPDSLFQKIKNKENVFIFDTRSTGEFEAGHIAASTNLSNNEITGSKLNSLKIDKTSNVAIVNQGEDVFETAEKTNELVSLGFVNAAYLQGGITAWKNAGLLLISSGGRDGDNDKVKTISIERLAADLDSADVIQFLDARSSSDYETGHIIGAINVPLAELEKNHAAISLVKKVVIYGGNEDEARKAATVLFDLNYFNAYVLEGGLDGWKSVGGKIETGN